LPITDYGLFLGGGEAVVTDAADFGARDGDLHVEVAGDLFLELLVKAGLEFADLAAAQAGYVDVVAWAMGFVVVAVAAKVEKVEFVDESFFLEEIDGAIDGDQVHGGVNFLRAGEDLVDIKMLLGVVHDFQDDAALAGEADALLAQSFLEAAGGLGSVEAFAGRDTMGRDGRHERIPKG